MRCLEVCTILYETVVQVVYTSTVLASVRKLALKVREHWDDLDFTSYLYQCNPITVIVFLRCRTCVAAWTLMMLRCLVPLKYIHTEVTILTSSCVDKRRFEMHFLQAAIL